MATTNKVKGWTGVLMTEDSSSHCQPSVDTSNPKRPGEPVGVRFFATKTCLETC